MDCYVIYLIMIVIIWYVFNIIENGFDNDFKVFGVFFKSVIDDVDYFLGCDVVFCQSEGWFVVIGYFVGE